MDTYSFVYCNEKMSDRILNLFGKYFKTDIDFTYR